MRELLPLGTRVRTSDDERVGVVTRIDGPCICDGYTGDEIRRYPLRSAAHYHIRVLYRTDAVNTYSEWLNGYIHDFTNVWDESVLIREEELLFMNLMYFNL